MILDRRSLLVGGIFALLCTHSFFVANLGADEREAFFEAKVRPLLIERCLECHGPDESSADLRFDQNPIAEKSPVVIAGKPDQSKLIRSVRYVDSSKAMPPDKKLSDEEIAILAQWVTDGAYWPKDDKPATAPAKMLPPAKRIDEIREQHWSYRPIGRFAPPSVRDEAWAKQPLDRFVLEKLEQNKRS